MSWVEVAGAAHPHLLKNDYDQCHWIIASALEACSHSPFHLALDSDFTNSIDDIARDFTEFFERESDRFTVAAIYTETNGFDINPSRWCFDIFGYDANGGLDDIDWISEWQSGSWPDVTLTGMEAVQEVYAAEELGTDQAYLSSLLVVVKFQRMIFRARSRMSIADIPLYSTGHDYDFITRC